MSGVVVLPTCNFCGLPIELAPEVIAPALAAGGAHPACRYRGALVASAAHRPPTSERLAMARWMARIAFARDDRRRARAGGAR